MCVSAVDAMARCSNCSLYVIDYNRKNFLYVSSNPLFLCGYSPEEVKAKGYEFYFDVVPEDEIGMLLEINDAGFGFYNSVQADRRLDCIIEYDFHIGLPHGRMRLIHHKLSPLLLSRGGDLWLALCAVSLSCGKDAGNVVIQVKGENERFSYSFVSKRWRKCQDVWLTEREADILRLSVQGMSNNEIAKCLYVDVNTVKYHKKILFDKLGARNIVEAIGVASGLQLI